MMNPSSFMSEMSKKTFDKYTYLIYKKVTIVS